MSEPIQNGELLLPVCIPENEITELLSALDLYRVLRKKAKSYIAFDAVTSALEYLDNPQDSPCLMQIAGSGVCWTADTTNSAIRFHPNDPFISIDLQDRPPIGQWERWEDSLKRPPGWVQNLIDFADNLPFFDKNIGYFPNDCFVVTPEENANDVTPFFDTLNALRQADFPYVEIEVSGTGELELHLLKVPFGGSAIIVWDIDFDIWNFLWDLVNGGSSPSGNIIQTELEREILTLPPEANEENVIEIDFTEDIDHVVRVYFVPRFDYTALDFLGNGGGIREISMCQNLTLKSPSGDTINKSNYKIDEFTREGFIMATKDEICAGMLCAMETVAQRILLAKDASNIENDVIIGALGDGGGFETTIESVSGLPIPEFNTTASEGRNGGAYNQAVQFAKLFTDTNSQITSGFSQNLIVKSLQYIMYSPALIYFSISDYVLTAVPVVIDIPKLAESIFCTGSFSNGLFEYASDPANHIETDFGYILDMAQDLSNSVISEWYADGKTSPRTDYQGYVCFRFPTKSLPGITYDVVSTANHPLLAFNDPTSYPTRTVRLEITGKITSNEGAEFDGMYGKDNAGVVTYNAPQIDSTTNTTPLNAPVYNPNGGYAVEYQVSGIMVSFIIARFAWNHLVGNTGITGELTVTVYDLGAN